MTVETAPALELIGIDKRFGAVHANRAVSFSVAAGAIHGLIGENGAGKSTLMNIVYGFYPADAGEIRVRGRRVEIRSPSDAIAAGIGMVHQHFKLVENFTVLENVALGAEGGWRLEPGLKRARSELTRLGREFGLEAPPLDEAVEHLPVGLQQRVEILKALYRNAEILILDEPTAVLSPSEADELFRMLGQLRAGGKTVILVTHKLREIMAATSRVTVMRQGEVVGEVATADTSPGELAEMMVGRPVRWETGRSDSRPGIPLLEVRGLEVRDHRGIPRVKGVDFEVCAGEIVGVAGVAGNGQSELLEAIAGLAAPSRGTIRIAGKEVDTGERAARLRRGRGLAHIPEDRLKMGLVAKFAAEDNAILGYHDRPDYRRGLFLDRRAIRRNCRAKMAGWDVRPAEPGLRISVFSGGNQQKLVVAREIDAAPTVLIVGQPTRGVDVGAIEVIHRRLVALRDARVAVLVVSVELEEILNLADRILVMAGGVVAGELARADATEEKLGLLMAGMGSSKTAEERSQ